MLFTQLFFQELGSRPGFKAFFNRRKLQSDHIEELEDDTLPDSILFECISDDGLYLFFEISYPMGLLNHIIVSPIFSTEDSSAQLAHRMCLEWCSLYSEVKGVVRTSPDSVSVFPLMLMKELIEHNHRHTFIRKISHPNNPI